MPKIGVGFRRSFAEWIHSAPAEIQCVEITAEHFFARGTGEGGRLAEVTQLADKYPLYVHGLGLSLGTPGPLDRDTLDEFSRVVEAANPDWISEHVAFTRTAEVDLGHLNPICPSEQSLAVFVEHVSQLAERFKRKVILENITSHLRIKGSMTEPEFLNRLCRESGCSLLLDVTNLLINSHNHGFDPRAWLDDIAPEQIVQLHVVGYSRHNGRLNDSHAAPIQDDLLELIEHVCRYAPVQAVIIERDKDFPSTDEMTRELKKLEQACGS